MTKVMESRSAVLGAPIWKIGKI